MRRLRPVKCTSIGASFRAALTFEEIGLPYALVKAALSVRPRCSLLSDSARATLLALLRPLWATRLRAVDAGLVLDA
jgi:hypothetical protein